MVPQGRRLRKRSQQKKHEEEDTRDTRQPSIQKPELGEGSRRQEWRMKCFIKIKKGRKGGERKGGRRRQRKKKRERLNRGKRMTQRSLQTGN